MFNKIFYYVFFLILSTNIVFAETFPKMHKLSHAARTKNRFGLVLNQNREYPIIIEYIICKYTYGGCDRVTTQEATIMPQGEFKISLGGFLDDEKNLKNVEFIVIKKASIKNSQKIAETQYDLSQQGCFGLSLNSRNGGSLHDSIIVLDLAVTGGSQIICQHIDNNAQMIE